MYSLEGLDSSSKGLEELWDLQAPGKLGWRVIYHLTGEELSKQTYWEEQFWLSRNWKDVD